LDLVEIAPKAEPPVVRIIDFKKFKYEESKKERTSKKKTREAETKEIWLGPLISKHDLEVRIEQTKAFLDKGDRVKLTVKFGGREIVHPEFGYKVLEKVATALEDSGEKDSEPKLVGRNLSFNLKPKKK
jgi:translation initiation factor IF-3